MTDIRFVTVQSHQQALRAEAEANRLAEHAARARRRSHTPETSTPGFAARFAAAAAAARRQIRPGSLLDRARYSG